MVHGPVHEGANGPGPQGWSMNLGQCFVYVPKIVLWSQCGVEVIENLSGPKAVVFLWQFGPLLCDVRAIRGTRSPRVTSLSSLYDGK